MELLLGAVVVVGAIVGPVPVSTGRRGSCKTLWGDPERERGMLVSG